MSGMRTIGMSQRRSEDSKKKRKNVLCWICGCIRGTGCSSFTSSSVIKGIWSCRGKERGDGAVGVTKALFSIGDCAFDSDSDKSHPGCQFSALQFHTFVEWHFEDRPVTC
jgi:hypothetical protein